ncbi:MAG: hypothetical protein COV74_01035 [Candidatus Omnitrophica bacterium CG11_big_fil_rev_8_21_14_0_20_45_26]|uniref:Multifunctional fusion protein n=1 Tax=Candidatus Abzuiibacterium crystallinum TaxID=1974748 RepID=A0A2H0LSN6_9BACT|nr:MAG: hypothetical protein COV74_01035 [Candidatus Omnitrophica bacterium CG11_big_fil_rev_8_21_14_0_20_45_26]PIW64164.1 MAG: hypothetical protein COW12_07295 [Candidatus Omnitrophica bacterium CG12_big_fil_rev_8_21_14_0_65_45_16]
MSEKQKTIKKEIRFEGTGIHSGKPVRVVLKPAPAGSGISFCRSDLSNAKPIRAVAENVFEGPGRQTALGTADWKIHTIEHLMATFHGLQIDNCLVEVNGEELPGLDGSAKDYVEAVLKAGFEEQEAEREYMNITRPMYYRHQDTYIALLPADELSVSYTLSYDHPDLADQFFSTSINSEVFASHIASARTFCLKQEAEQLQKMGYGKGANLSNTLVFDKNKPLENSLRFTNEACRHKIMDLLGDLYLAGQFFKGHIVACRSGHAQNLQMVKQLADFRTPRYKDVGITLKEGEAWKINGIKRILPHRFPFLFVDEVVEMEEGKRIVGKRKISPQEFFFQGHFPGHPVMPGVIIIEALAQCGGFLMLSKPENQGKIAYFMTIDNVKFRQPVLPGDELRFEVDVIRARTKTGECAGKAFVGDKLVCEADVRFAVVDSN